VRGFFVRGLLRVAFAASTDALGQYGWVDHAVLVYSDSDGSGSPLTVETSLLASFTGQLYDADAELYYYRARWYDPVLGKFLSDDPMSFAAGDANVSRYVGNASVSFVDPAGLEKTLILRVDQPGEGGNDDRVHQDCRTDV
jgi:RHS repeat-associated protein